MTRDDIIRMAGQADLDWHRYWDDDESNRLERFAALVAAAQCDACVKACEQEALLWPWSKDFRLCVAAIRARGKK